MVAPATWMFAPVIWMVPPLVPLRLPAADSVPDTVTVGLRARAYRLVPVGPPSTILPLWLPMVSASITPELLMTELTILRAATAVSTTVPPLALSVPAFSTSDLSGLPVATSITCEAILSVSPSVIRLSPYMSSVNALPDASAMVPSLAMMVPVLRTPGATSAAKPPVCAVIVPRLTIEAFGLPGMLKL